MILKMSRENSYLHVYPNVQLLGLLYWDSSDPGSSIVEAFSVKLLVA